MGILTLVSSLMIVQRVKIQWGWSPWGIHRHLLWIHDACPCTINQCMRLLHKFKRSRRKEKVQHSHAFDDCVWTHVVSEGCPRLPHGAVPTEFFRKEEIKRPTDDQRVEVLMYPIIFQLLMFFYRFRQGWILHQGGVGSSLRYRYSKHEAPHNPPYKLVTIEA